MSRTDNDSISAFNLTPGRIIAGKYEVLSMIGRGWEGEVYKIRELRTGIERAAKLFFPQRNPQHKTSKYYAKKLHKLRNCPILIQYYTEEQLVFRKTPITVLISEYVEGQLLNHFVQQAPRGRLPPYLGLHLLYALVKGIEQIHLQNEYHGDLHTQNVIVTRFGLNFHLKLVDLYNWSTRVRENRKDDICDTIRIFYDCLGGAKYYSSHPQTVKDICLGLKRTLILKKFRTATQLREYLETLEWSDY